jgi:hypothetical protein
MIKYIAYLQFACEGDSRAEAAESVAALLKSYTIDELVYKTIIKEVGHEEPVTISGDDTSDNPRRLQAYY